VPTPTLGRVSRDSSFRGQCLTPRRLYRRGWLTLYQHLAGRWRGTRGTLRRLICRFLKPYRWRLGFLLRLARDA